MLKGEKMHDNTTDDLIRRQAAIDYFVINVGFHDEDGDAIDDSDELRKIWTEYFDGIPSVDAVPVVRCANCIWMQCNMQPDGTLPKGVDEYECRHWCGACDPTDFCSYGERRDG